MFPNLKEEFEWKTTYFSNEGYVRPGQQKLSSLRGIDSLFVFLQFSLTPLHLAAWYGHKSVVKLLLQYGADVNAVDRVS